MMLAAALAGEYVVGQAGAAAGVAVTFAGSRDSKNQGMTPADFRSRINRIVKEKAVAVGQSVDEEMLLSEDEVLSIRL